MMRDSIAADGQEAGLIKAFFEQLRAIDEEQLDLNERRRDILKAAKDAEIDGKTLRVMIMRARKAPEEVMEADRLLETYEAITGTGANVGGALATKRNPDGTFEVRMVQPAAPAKLTNADKRLRDSVLLAQLEERARRGE
jgi:uncharacterized protein (UPF0335 family)